MPTYRLPPASVSYHLEPGLLAISVSSSGVCEGETWSVAYSYWVDESGVWWGQPGDRRTRASGPAAGWLGLSRRELEMELDAAYRATPSPLYREGPPPLS